MSKDKKIELMCNIGDEILKMLKDEGYIRFIYTQHNPDNFIYTDKTQHLFDKIYDILDNNIPDEESNR